MFELYPYAAIAHLLLIFVFGEKNQKEYLH